MTGDQQDEAVRRALRRWHKGVVAGVWLLHLLLVCGNLMRGGSPTLLHQFLLIGGLVYLLTWPIPEETTREQ